MKIGKIGKCLMGIAVLLLLGGCADTGKGSVYYLNFKAEQDEA